MKATLIGRVAAAAAGVTLACAAHAGVPESGPSLYVYSTIDALLAGEFDGDATVSDVRKYGDFGLGTFNGLDGEMVALDGVYYHVRADGSIKVAPDTERIPLAYVVPFKPGASFELSSFGSLKELEAALDARLTNRNVFWAVRIDGRLASVTTRAIPLQSRPYVPLAEAAKHQVLFTKQDVDATLVGLRSPEFSRGISVVGWHWHVVSSDHTTIGGHVLAASLTRGAAQVEAVRDMTLHAPDIGDQATADRRDRSAELHQVEGAR